MTQQLETEAEVAESYGRDLDNLDTVQSRMWDDQQSFLGNYATAGTILSAAKAANVSRQTAYNWRDSGALAFRERFQAAKESFRESLDDIMFQRLRDPKTHPVLLIFALKGHWRDKYGDTAVPSEDSAKDVLRTLMDWKPRAMEEAETILRRGQEGR